MADNAPVKVDTELLVAFIEQHYNLTGEILSADKAYEDYGIPVGAYKEIFEDENTKKFLQAKGIVFERLGDDWTAKSLTPKQLMVANMLLDLTDSRSEKKKLQDCEVPTATYNTWLKDPVFKQYIQTRSRQMIGDNEHQVDLALLDRIRAGDLKAIQYYHEWQGIFTPQRANAANVDVQNIIVKIIEIITEEVTNQEDAIRISNRLRAMVAARNVAGALMSSDEEPIEVPEVVSIRKIQELDI